MNDLRFWYHFKIFLGLCACFVFSGLFITESLELASAVTTTDSTGMASTVENKNVSVNGPDTALYDSATQEILTTHQYLTAGNGSGGLTLQHSNDTVTTNIKTTTVYLKTEIAYPLDSPIFEQRMEFCILNLTNITSIRRVVECDYLCQCSKRNDCQELNLFMANQEKMASWSLCEISARNVF